MSQIVCAYTKHHLGNDTANPRVSGTNRRSDMHKAVASNSYDDSSRSPRGMRGRKYCLAQVGGWVLSGFRAASNGIPNNSCNAKGTVSSKWEVLFIARYGLPHLPFNLSVEAIMTSMITTYEPHTSLTLV